LVTSKSIWQHKPQLSSLFANFVILANLSKLGYGQSAIQHIAWNVASQSRFHPYVSSIQSNIPQLWTSRSFSDISTILADFSELLPNFTGIHADVSTILSDLTGLQSDVADISHISSIQPNISQLESDLAGLRRCRSQTDLSHVATIFSHLPGVQPHVTSAQPDVSSLFAHKSSFQSISEEPGRCYESSVLAKQPKEPRVLSEVSSHVFDIDIDCLLIFPF
jgi:hypothetical protein